MCLGNCMSRFCCGRNRDNDSVGGVSDRRGCGCGGNRDNDSVGGTSDRRGCGCGESDDNVGGTSDRCGCGCRCCNRCPGMICVAASNSRR